MAKKSTRRGGDDHRSRATDRVSIGARSRDWVNAESPLQTPSEHAPGTDVVDESALAREVIGDCRRNVALLRDVGRRLDEEYSRERLAERRALHVQRERAPKEEQFEIPGPRRVTHVLNYGPSYWADRQDWPKRADPAHQLQNRFLAVLHDVMGGKFHSNLRPVVDRESALIVLLLHWLLADESAGSFEPKVCEFQALPWFTEKMVGRRTVATMWFALPHKAEWCRRVKEALEWARLIPGWAVSDERVGGEVGERVTVGTTPPARPALRADQLSSPERTELVALERARRESPPGAPDALETTSRSAGRFRPARFFPKGMRDRLRRAFNEKRISGKKDGNRNFYSLDDALRLWPDENIRDA